MFGPLDTYSVKGADAEMECQSIFTQESTEREFGYQEIDKTGAKNLSIWSQKIISFEDMDDDVPIGGHPVEKELQDKTPNNIAGVICIAIGTLLMGTVGVAVKQHGGSVLQLMEGRYIMQFALAALWWNVFPPPDAQSWAGHPGFRRQVWLRGAIYFFLIFFWWRALETVAIGDAEAILYLSPVLTALAAKGLLGEPLPRMFPVTAGLTIFGVVLVSQPALVGVFADARGRHKPSPQGLLFLFLCCLCWTATSLLLRSARGGMHWLQVELVSSTQAVFWWTPLLLVFGHSVQDSTREAIVGGDWDFSGRSLILMIAIGVLGFAGLCFNVVGYQVGDPSVVGWVQHLDVVIAYAFQHWVFKQNVTGFEACGVVLLLVSCMIRMSNEAYVAWRQQLKDHCKHSNTETTPLLMTD